MTEPSALATLAAPAETSLGVAATCPEVSARAAGYYDFVAEALPRLWPTMPDEQRVRFYLWASRHVAEARAMLLAAYELLDHAAFWMSAFVEMVDDFEETGTVPSDIADEDVVPVADPVARVLADRLAVALTSRPALPAPSPMPLLPAASPTPLLPASRKRVGYPGRHLDRVLAAVRDLGSAGPAAICDRLAAVGQPTTVGSVKQALVKLKAAGRVTSERGAYRAVTR